MPDQEQDKSIHVWIPNIFAFKGGIQVYSGFLLKALQNSHPHIQYEVFLKHDTYASANFINSTQFHCAGTFPLAVRTLVFAAQILGHGLWQRPRLVIATHLNFTPAAYCLKRMIGVPYWIVVHGVESWNIQRPALKRALYHADRILAVSHYTRDRLLNEQHLDPTKISVLPNTFDATRFHIAPKPQYLLKRYNLTEQQPIILTVARLESSEQYKGYDHILQALPEIRRQIPQVHYILVGKGSDRARIEQLITKLNLQDCVTLTGLVPDEEMCDHYNLCDVFAMPSKGEGFGIVYLEALACGKPTLGGNQDGAIDALCQGKLGALVDPDDVDAIAKMLIQILQANHSNSLLYQPEILRQNIIDTFGVERFKQTLTNYFNS